ncbi:fibropellin-3-like [Mytilus edulis]|uniref:fibropellin-3-like n=1 Tax=Mytilus edulis TaxID=6550 RepID=UPI0039EFB7ED
MHLLWTKCAQPCEGIRQRETLMCCVQNKQTSLNRNDCLKMCNKTVKDIVEEMPCAQRCDHGTYDNKRNCHCQPGYSGQCCEIELDECMSSPCKHGSCRDNVNGYTCACNAGFTGINCDIDIDECMSSPCKHGSCTDQVNGYACACHAGFTGINCKIDINECSSSPCHQGTCQNNINGYSCTCNSGYTGSDCELDINECSSSPCHHGTCQDNINGYSCTCNSGYTGSDCELEKGGRIIQEEVENIDLIAETIDAYAPVIDAKPSEMAIVFTAMKQCLDMSKRAGQQYDVQTFNN